MRRRSIIIASAGIFAAIVTQIVATGFKSAPPLELTVVNVAELGTKKLVTVEFQRRDSGARFDEVHRVQVHLAGAWQPPLSLPKFGDDSLLALTNREEVIFSVPTEADTFRFSLGYRVGPRPYCQAYFFLERHGLRKEFPKFSRTVLRFVPQQPGLRRVRRDLVIPRPTHNKTTTLDAAPGVLFSFGRHWSGASELVRSAS